MKIQWWRSFFLYHEKIRQLASMIKFRIRQSGHCKTRNDKTKKSTVVCILNNRVPYIEKNNPNKHAHMY